MKIVEQAPTKVYVHGTNTSFSIGNFSLNVVEIGDKSCLNTTKPTCSGKIELGVEIGNKIYYIHTNTDRTNIDGTKYQMEAVTENGQIVINIYGLALE